MKISGKKVGKGGLYSHTHKKEKTLRSFLPDWFDGIRDLIGSGRIGLLSVCTKNPDGLDIESFRRRADFAEALEVEDITWRDRDDFF